MLKLLVPVLAALSLIACTTTTPAPCAPMTPEPQVIIVVEPAPAFQPAHLNNSTYLMVWGQCYEDTYTEGWGMRVSRTQANPEYCGGRP